MCDVCRQLVAEKELNQQLAASRVQAARRQKKQMAKLQVRTLLVARAIT